MWNANFNLVVLEGANLSQAQLWGANLSESYLRETNLERSDLHRANLSEANLELANLGGADLREANLSGVKKWTVEQLEQAKTLEGAIMPDGVQLCMEEAEFQECIEGPTFEQWKAQYLARVDTENIETGSDDAANTEQTEDA